jgi:hypothetical protein
VTACVSRSPRAQPSGAAAIAAVLEHAPEQLLDRLPRLELELVRYLLARQHQPRLELEQSGDQDQELGRRLEIQLPGPLEMLDVGEHDLGQVDLEQVDLLAQHERQEQVERPLEDLELEVERGERHGGRLGAPPVSRARRRP